MDVKTRYNGFMLNVLMENEAMQTPEDVADALERTAAKIRANDDLFGAVMDVNGNKVGEYRRQRFEQTTDHREGPKAPFS